MRVYPTFCGTHSSLLHTSAYEYHVITFSFSVPFHVTSCDRQTIHDDTKLLKLSIPC